MKRFNFNTATLTQSEIKSTNAECNIVVDENAVRVKGWTETDGKYSINTANATDESYDITQETFNRYVANKLIDLASGEGQTPSITDSSITEAKLADDVKTKLNKQADWTQSDNTALDYIKNKPTLGNLASANGVDYSQLTGSLENDLNSAFGENGTIDLMQADVDSLKNSIQRLHAVAYSGAFADLNGTDNVVVKDTNGKITANGFIIAAGLSGNKSDYVLLADGGVKLISDIVEANPGTPGSSDPENPSTVVNGIQAILIESNTPGTITYQVDSNDPVPVTINGWDALNTSITSKADKSQLINSNNGTAGFVKIINFNSQPYNAVDGVFTLPYIAINDARINTTGSGVDAKINIPIASNGKYGVIKTNFSNNDNDKNYAVKVDSYGNAYVNVPWTSGGSIDPDSTIVAKGFKVDGHNKDGFVLFADGSNGTLAAGDIPMTNWPPEDYSGDISSEDTVLVAISKLDDKVTEIAQSVLPVDYINTITINGSSTGVSKTSHTVDLTMTDSGTPTDLSNYVTISGNETIGGTKQFSNTVRAAGFSTGAPSGTTNVLFADGSYKDETATDVKMTNYSKGSSVAAITTTDTVSTAIGKLENKIEAVSGSKQPTIVFKQQASDSGFGATTLIGPFSYEQGGVATLDLSDYAKITDIPTTGSEAFTGATQNAAGTSGLVPAPAARGTNGDIKYLTNTGSWEFLTTNWGNQISAVSDIRTPEDHDLYYDASLKCLCIGVLGSNNENGKWIANDGFTVRRQVGSEWQDSCYRKGNLKEMPKYLDLQSENSADVSYPFFLTYIKKQVYLGELVVETVNIPNATSSTGVKSISTYCYRWVDSQGNSEVISRIGKDGTETPINVIYGVYSSGNKLYVRTVNGNTESSSEWTTSSAINLGYGNDDSVGIFKPADKGKMFMIGDDAIWTLTNVATSDSAQTQVPIGSRYYYTKTRTFTYTFTKLGSSTTKQFTATMNITSGY